MTMSKLILTKTYGLITIQKVREILGFSATQVTKTTSTLPQYQKKTLKFLKKSGNSISGSNRKEDGCKDGTEVSTRTMIGSFNQSASIESLSLRFIGSRG